MATVPQDPSALTDDQLIEALALEVMGWSVDTSGKTPMFHRGKGSKPRESWDFCPLTDWNHTMEVVSRMHGKGWGFRTFDMPWIEEGEDAEWLPFAAFFAAAGDEFEAQDTNLRRAICRAAIQSVRSGK